MLRLPRCHDVAAAATAQFRHFIDAAALRLPQQRHYDAALPLPPARRRHSFTPR
jgi:hypothetical protein